MQTYVHYNAQPIHEKASPKDKVERPDPTSQLSCSHSFKERALGKFAFGFLVILEVFFIHTFVFFFFVLLFLLSFIIFNVRRAVVILY